MGAGLANRAETAAGQLGSSNRGTETAEAETERPVWGSYCLSSMQDE
jgi:hypothetical protein